MKRLTCLVVLILSINTQLIQDGHFCNTHDDCQSGCCFRMKCYPNQNCETIQDFEVQEKEVEYCNVSGDCDSHCCRSGECKGTGHCFVIYELPIIMAALLACCIACCCFLLVCILANAFIASKKNKDKTVEKTSEPLKNINKPAVLKYKLI